MTDLNGIGDNGEVGSCQRFEVGVSRGDTTTADRRQPMGKEGMREDARWGLGLKVERM
jgi:hypothetical protein